MLAGLAGYLLVQTFTGSFGGGTGPIIFYILITFLGLTIIEAAATQLVPVLVLYIASVAVFARNGLIDYGLGLVLLVGMAAGGHVGANIALRKGNEWVKGLFAAVVAASALRLLLT